MILNSFSTSVVHGVLTAVSAPSNGWLGGSDSSLEGAWAWADGLAWGYSSWWAGQPGGGDTQNCLQMRHSDKLWDDVKCEATRTSYVCKK